MTVSTKLSISIESRISVESSSLSEASEEATKGACRMGELQARNCMIASKLWKIVFTSAETVVRSRLSCMMLVT